MIVFQCSQYYVGEVDKVYVGIVIVLFVIDGGFDIINCCVVVSVLWFNIEFNKFWDYDFVVVECWYFEVVMDYLYVGVEEIVVYFCMVMYVEVRLSGMQVIVGFEDCVREWIYCVYWLIINQILFVNSDVLIQWIFCRGF